ncbi:MAG: InlB B-repeat-containing protein, partial [Lachnospiraceae bacterium]|nr:InlB B-repeat-containing protein [Lachnospiraceae bacterium]
MKNNYSVRMIAIFISYTLFMLLTSRAIACPQKSEDNSSFTLFEQVNKNAMTSSSGTTCLTTVKDEEIVELKQVGQIYPIDPYCSRKEREDAIKLIEKIVSEVINPEMSDIEKYWALADWEYKNCITQSNDNNPFYQIFKDGFDNRNLFPEVLYARLCHAAGLACDIVARLSDKMLGPTDFLLEWVGNYIPNINGHGYLCDVQRNRMFFTEDQEREFIYHIDYSGDEFPFATISSTKLGITYGDFDYLDTDTGIRIHAATTDPSSDPRNNPDITTIDPYVEKGSGIRGETHAKYEDYFDIISEMTPGNKINKFKKSTDWKNNDFNLIVTAELNGGNLVYEAVNGFDEDDKFFYEDDKDYATTYLWYGQPLNHGCMLVFCDYGIHTCCGLGNGNVKATKEGYEFAGWYRDPELTVPWKCSFPWDEENDDIVTSDTILYAKWIEKTIPVEGVTLDKTSITLKVGDTQMLKATVTPENAMDKSLKWFSGNNDVASVEQDGTVTALKTGKTYITVQSVNGLKTDSCDVTVQDDGSTVPVTFTVRFDMNGKTVADAPTSQSVEQDGTAVRPAKDPEAEGFTFDGWYREAACENLFDFSTPITADTIIYAKWIDEKAEFFTVTFDLNGKPGTTPSAQTVEKDRFAKEPAVPEAEGFTFGGWYREATCENLFDFSTPITADTVVYAKWIEKKTETFTVSFDLNGKPGTAPAAQTVEKDGFAKEPATPEAEGFTFTGWFTEAACGTKYDFSTPVTADLTLYAGWEAKTEPGPGPGPGPEPEPEPVVIDEGDSWNLYEDASEHEYQILGISVDGTVSNSNSKSKVYYDAKITGSTITVKVTGDRKEA